MRGGPRAELADDDGHCGRANRPFKRGSQHSEQQPDEDQQHLPPGEARLRKCPYKSKRLASAGCKRARPSAYSGLPVPLPAS